MSTIVMHIEGEDHIKIIAETAPKIGEYVQIPLGMRKWDDGYNGGRVIDVTHHLRGSGSSCYTSHITIKLKYEVQ